MRTPPPLPKPKPSQLSQSPLGHLGGPDTAQRHDVYFTVAKITQSDAFNYMPYHFLCKRGIRPARTEQFLVFFVFFPCGGLAAKFRAVFLLQTVCCIHCVDTNEMLCRIIFGCLATSQNMLYLPLFKTGHLSNNRIYRQGQYLPNLLG